MILSYFTLFLFGERLMVDITLSIVLQFVQTVGILVGIIYYISIMRANQKTQERTLKAQEEAEKSRKREMIFSRSQSYTLEFAQAYIAVENMFKNLYNR